MPDVDPKPDPVVDDREREVRAFVGRNADYYLKKWQPLLREGTGSAGFNWAAFLLCGFWIPYRKMYGVAIILYGFIIVETLLEDILFIGILGEPESPGALSNSVSLLIWIVCGAFGNRWYLSHAKKRIADVHAQNLEGDAALELISQRGGTSLGASLAFFLLFIVVFIGGFIVVDIMLFGL